VLGLRAGRYAARKLAANPFQLEAVVHCPGRRPYTCFIDGIQVSSGCTMGKGNIRHIRSGRVWVEFRLRTPPGKGAVPSTRLELRPELWAELHLNPDRNQRQLAARARALFRRPFAELFIEQPAA